MSKGKIYSSTLPNRTIEINGETFLHFSGTSYLGISTNPVFITNLKSSIDQFGSNFGGSRLSNIQFPIFEQAESILANKTGSPSALTCSSGSYAGLLVLEQFGKDCVFVKNGQVHRAIDRKEGISLKLAVNNELEKFLDLLAKEKEKPVVVLSNSIDPLFAKKMSFEWLKRIPYQKNLYFILDDSHGIGIKGKSGGGIYPEISSVTENKIIIVASLGKALGIPGGAICATEQFIQKIKQSPSFGGSSPIPPAYLDAFVKSQHLYKKSLEKVRENIYNFGKKVDSFQLFEHLSQYPVFYTKQNELAEFLFEHKIVISSFPYPGPNDGLITRVVLNASHTTEDIDTIARLIKLFPKK